MFINKITIFSLAALCLVTLQAQAWWLYAPETGALVNINNNSNNATTQDQASGAPKAAQAKFEMDGVTGFMRFRQHAKKHILVDYELRNLKGNNQLYHVHVRPVPAFNPEEIKNKPGAIGDLCNEPATGGHLNPTNIKEKLPPKSAPFDKYEIGDLAGKHGALQKVDASTGEADLYRGSFEDPTLELTGPNGIIGRSIVIHNSDGGKRWVCASILELKE